MAKRMFNDDEKKLAEKRLVDILEEVSHIDWLLKYNTLMVEEGLEMNYKEKVRGYKKQIKIDKDERAEKMFIVNTLKDQLENGVEEIVLKEESE